MIVKWLGSRLFTLHFNPLCQSVFVSSLDPSPSAFGRTFAVGSWRQKNLTLNRFEFCSRYCLFPAYFNNCRWLVLTLSRTSQIAWLGTRGNGSVWRSFFSVYIPQMLSPDQRRTTAGFVLKQSDRHHPDLLICISCLAVAKLVVHRRKRSPQAAQSYQV